MKSLEKPFSDYWYGEKAIEKSIQTTEPNPDESEDDQYRTLKRVIQQEAIRRWSRS
ncbi:hypothetical protein [Halalkalibacter alkalisediminis]|uniref:Uncharacterized protein n=1 Tax=Halalkalibacter alkalisediminis TaxID=935616 RepID=A0ABV6NC71_9BACI|nr:hypothetical protein [Halalkalibacter alkalisediminis]